MASWISLNYFGQSRLKQVTKQRTIPPPPPLTPTPSYNTIHNLTHHREANTFSTIWQIIRRKCFYQSLYLLDYALIHCVEYFQIGIVHVTSHFVIALFTSYAIFKTEDSTRYSVGGANWNVSERPIDFCKPDVSTSPFTETQNIWGQTGCSNQIRCLKITLMYTLSILNRYIWGDYLCMTVNIFQGQVFIVEVWFGTKRLCECNSFRIKFNKTK